MSAFANICQTTVFCLSIFTAPITVWTAITALIGLFKEKTINAGISKYYSFAILICARDEEGVIGNLIESLTLQDYKGEFKIYVVADNCKDNTARIAASCGVNVFIREDFKHIGKGYAMRFGIKKILKENPTVEAVCVFDADNLASRSFLTEINRAFNTNAKVVCGYRDTKNIHDSWITEAYCVYWLMLMRFYYNTRFVLGLSPMVGGTGFAFLVSCLDIEGWDTKTLTEDVEFSIQQILKNNNILYANKAVYYDEQPKSFKASIKQRLRWMSGGIQCLFLYCKKVFCGIIDGNRKLWDVLWYLFFIPATGVILILNTLTIIVVYATPELNNYLIPAILIIIILLFCPAWIIAYATLELEKRSIKPMRKAILLYPIFMITMMIVATIAIFRPKTEWSPIKHSNSSTIKQREQERQ